MGSVTPVQSPPGDGTGRARRHDPDRRERIIEACLDVIATEGVGGTSHRKVAAVADVPLGSMTYHFSGMNELLREALNRFGREVSDRFERRIAAATGPQEAAQAVLAIIAEDTPADARELVLTQELYTLAARDPSYRDITSAWMARSRAALERHFDPVTARLLGALIEGLSLHRALASEPSDTSVVAEAIERITGHDPGAALESPAERVR
jgi:DNA-binding transcriptional regulator YbjK